MVVIIYLIIGFCIALSYVHTETDPEWDMFWGIIFLWLVGVLLYVCYFICLVFAEFIVPLDDYTNLKKWRNL